MVGLVSLVLGCSLSACLTAKLPAERSVSSVEAAKASPSASAALNPSALEQDFWSRLQQAEHHYFILIRHALAPGTGDPGNFQLDNCATQRNLSAAGREQARRLGDALKQRGIAVKQVLSSQWCRCLETAELIAVGEVEPFPALNSFFRDRAPEPAQTTQVRDFMRAQATAPGITVMVAHFMNSAALAGMSLGRERWSLSSWTRAIASTSWANSRETENPVAVPIPG